VIGIAIVVVIYRKLNKSFCYGNTLLKVRAPIYFDLAKKLKAAKKE
jgi:hypothetical protein